MVNIMNAYDTTQPANPLVEPFLEGVEIAHIVWSALTSLYMHKHQHGEMSNEHETHFLIRWCLRSLKNKSFAEKYSSTLHFLVEDWQQSALYSNLHQYLLHTWIAYA